MEQDDHLGDDLLRGGRPIARFVFGNDGAEYRRKIYYLAETERLPVFRLGKTLCGRKSTLRAWIAGQERVSIRGLKSGEVA